MPSNHIQVVHKNLARRAMMVEKRADPPACSTIYLSPTMGQVINSLDPLPITWNSTCLSVQAIDIYLYSPNAALPRIHVWENVALSRGTYNATLLPRWWNSTATQSLQVSIVPAGQPPFLSQFPGGPVFNATYTAPASGTPPAADTTIVSSGITQVNDLANAKNALTPGKKAAAALLTLLFVALCIAAYIKIKRNKGKKERRRWTEAVDKRMSTISTDWKSVSVAGANAAIRNSIAVGNRSSSFSFGAIRPPSTFSEDEKRSMSQMRTGVGLRNPATPATTERVSRVSFAPDTRISRSSVADPRPSGESRRTRAFHTGYVPPVPSLPAADESDSGPLSPRQSQGPLTLTPDDIRARIATSKRAPSTTTPNTMSNSANDMDEVMPALRMMRTGSDPSAPDDFLLKAPIPPVPAVPKSIIAATPPVPQRTASPVISSMAMEPMPANVMSPDDMLRVYAERKQSISTPSSSSLSSRTSISYPKAIAKKGSMKSKHNKRMGGSNTMRVLYNATTGSLGSTDAAYGGMDEKSTSRQSASSIPEEVNMAGMGAGIGHANANVNPFGYHLNASIGIGAYGGGNQYAIGEDEVDVGVAGRGAGAGTHYLGRAT